MITDFSMVLPLVKIDEERRLIIARAAQELPDKAKEVMDYATAKPAFQAWSDSFSAMSGGLSKGNVRVMHQKTVAGKLTDLSFNDPDMAVDVVMKIVDDNEWRKCLEGCYTGVSVGGGYAKRWKGDDGLTHYTPIVRELSLVDNPCIPTAKFAELVKADGMSVQVALIGVPRTFSELWTPPPQTFAEMWRVA